MVRYKLFNMLVLASVVASLLVGGGSPVLAQTPVSAPTHSSAAAVQAQGTTPNDEIGTSMANGQMRRTTTAMRQAAAAGRVLNQRGASINLAGINKATALNSPLASKSPNLAVMAPPNSDPDYFGIANWALSPLPQINSSGTITPGTGMRKFVDTLPGLSLPTSSPVTGNDLGQYIPVAAADKTTFPVSGTTPAADYYEIGLVQYREQLHADLPPVVTDPSTHVTTGGTLLRGYVQVETPANASVSKHIQLFQTDGTPITHKDSTGTSVPVFAVDKPSYLGPTVLALRNRPVRVKFTNFLPTGPAGNLFLPVDTTYMGAGMGPGGSINAINITNPGAGYNSTPTVTFDNTGTGGTGAAATAQINNGQLIGVTITNGGSNYTTAPTIIIGGGGFTTRAAATAVLAGQPGDTYTQNRATLHLHGGNTPWISDGTPHQWTVPNGEVTSYSKGVSASYVPDMWFDQYGNIISSCANATTCTVAGASNDPGLGSLSFYYTNQQSGRLMFYHDHAYGITRLNVYGGEAAGYLLTDPAQEDALAAAKVPGTIGSVPATTDLAHVIPLVIQDKTFVPDSGTPGGQLALEDPTWDLTHYGGFGNLWFPHVYMTNQNPADVTGANNFGRWDYGPWFWPAQDPSTFVPNGLPYGPPRCSSIFYGGANPGPAFPPLTCPGFPKPSGTPEAFMDTPVINGTAYPSLTVDPTAYRFQMLMAGNDRTWNLGLYVAEPLSVAMTNGGTGYSPLTPPTVNFVGGGGSGATAAAVISTGSVTGGQFTNVGSGYKNPPNVTITGDGTGATATALLGPANPPTTTDNTVGSITITNPGSGYTNATITIDPPAGCISNPPTTICTQATVTAVLTPAGEVVGVKVINPGSGWTSAPTVTITGGTGTGASAIASINTEVHMVDAVPHTASSTLPLCSINPTAGGAQQAMAVLDGNGNPLNGTGLQPGCWPSTWPTDGRDGGVPDPTTAGPPIIQIGAEGGILPNPVVIPSTPAGYEYNRRSITVLNLYTHGLTLGPAERADVVIDFSKFAGKTLIVYNDAPAPIPAFDPRNDYYTGDPDNTFQGGAPTTLPGYGPNTRTIMQIKVNASVGGAGGAGTSVASVTLTNGGTGYTAPSVAIAAPGGAGATATASVSGSVSGLNLTSAGSGYSKPVVTIAAPSCTPGPNCTQATAAMSSGVINSLTLGLAGSNYTSAPAVTFTGGGGSLAAAKSTVSVAGITFNGGAGYSAAPTVGIADSLGGTGTGATLSPATVSVTGLTFAGGAGYSSAPTVAIADSGGGTGTGATLSPATVSVTGLTFTGGAGYSSAPTVAIADSGGGIGTGATLSPATISVTGLAGFTTNGVACTTIPPVISITDSGGTPTTVAVATATLDVNNIITGISITTNGAGYTNPVFTLTDATCTASATPTGAVDSLTLLTPGAKYTAPVITFTGGAPTTAASASTTGAVDSLTLLTPGAKYTAPVITFTGGSPTTAASASTTGVVDSLTLLTPGAKYTAPVITFTGGAPSTPASASTTGVVDSLTLVSPGTGYTAAPTVGFTGGGGSGATATATIASTGLVVVSGGAGYTTNPAVTIADTPPGTGSGAAANSTLSITNLTLLTGGSGYTAIPAVTISDLTGLGATAVASLTGPASNINLPGITTALPTIFTNTQDPIIIPEPSYPAGNGFGAAPTYSRIQDTFLTGWFGVGIGSLTLTPGSGYGSAPTVTIAPPSAGGTQATATLSFTGGTLATLTLVSGGAGYSSAPTVTFTGGGGSGAAATASFRGTVSKLNLTNGGSGYRVMPGIAIGGGGGSGAAATATGAVTGLALTNPGGSGYTSAPTVNFTGGGGSGAAATAIVSAVPPFRVTGFTITNGGSGYTSRPTVTITGGGGSGANASATLSVTALNLTSQGSNYATPPTVTFFNGGTGGSGASASTTLSGSVTALLITNIGSGYGSAPTVGFTGGGTPTTPASATATTVTGKITGVTLTNPGSGYHSAPLITLTGGGGTGAALVANPPQTFYKPKAIQELFTLDYGRMNATLGVELPFTNFATQTTIPYGYVDPPTELYQDGQMQIWKITHNGVDTHFIHFHLFTVQVINRVGWDGMIKPPDNNEIGWKDTVRMNPLEDVIVALKPMKQTLPWEITNSIRPLDVTQPIGAALPNEFTNIDPLNQPATVVNALTNFGWEYVWHCHILGHEENDMMRAAAMSVAPDAPTNVTAVHQGGGNSQSARLTWKDNAINETGFTIERANSLAGPWLVITSALPPLPGTGTMGVYTDFTVARRTSYFYRVTANNVVGYSATTGYPTLSADSAAVTAPSAVVTFAPVEAGPIFADSFENTLARWSGVVGSASVAEKARIALDGGVSGMAATIGAAQQPAYVYDLSPNGVGMYDANFYFNPNKAVSGDNPVDIFLGLDQNSVPAFGVQYKSVDANSFMLRGWVMLNGDQVFTAWDTITIAPPEEPEDISNATHKIDVAFMSGSSAGMSLYIDDKLWSTLTGDTSATTVKEALLGPSQGLSAASSGTMYFDAFTSSQLPGVTYLNYLSFAAKP